MEHMSISIFKVDESTIKIYNYYIVSMDCNEGIGVCRN